MTTFATKPFGAGSDFDPFFEAASLERLQNDDKQQYYLAMKTEYEIRVSKEYSFREGLEQGLE